MHQTPSPTPVQQAKLDALVARMASKAESWREDLSEGDVEKASKDWEDMEKILSQMESYLAD